MGVWVGCGRRGCFPCRVAGAFGAPTPRCLAGWIRAGALSLAGGERFSARSLFLFRRRRSSFFIRTLLRLIFTSLQLFLSPFDAASASPQTPSPSHHPRPPPTPPTRACSPGSSKRRTRRSACTACARGQGRRQGRGHVIWARRGGECYSGTPRGFLRKIAQTSTGRPARVLYQLRWFWVGTEMVVRMSGGYRVLQSKRVDLAVLSALKFGAIWDVRWGKRRKFRGRGDELGFITELWRTG
ncbi:hypothetical protein DFH09DRAFT_1152157 [Mycena vulgaris]|nr:hypothetical protein DFH09DRAFT_1152157 [Mycena vulgaris]